jgi:hypothetical protein
MVLIPLRLRVLCGILPYAFAFVFLAACQSHGVRVPRADEIPGLDGGAGGNADPFLRDLRAVLIPISWACIALGIASLVASYFLPLVPRRASLIAIGSGVGCLLLLGLVAKFGGFIAWTLLISACLLGLATGLPFLIGAFRWSQRRAGVDLEPGDGPGAG